MSGQFLGAFQEVSTSIVPPQREQIASSWFATYTVPRHEKSVARQLEDRGVQQFLPLYTTTHRWRNGRHKVQLPLFPGYIFVQLNPTERSKVLEVPGVVYIVASHGVPVSIPSEEIEQLRNALQAGVLARPYPYLKVGARVEIRNGPLQGLIGIIQRWHGKFRVIISVDLIMQSMVVDVDASDVTPIGSARSCRN